MKVKDFIKFLLNFDQNLEVYTFEQLITGMDGDLLPLTKKLVKGETVIDFMKKNPNAYVYTNKNTLEEDKVLILNYKTRAKEYEKQIEEIEIIDDYERKNESKNIEVIDIEI